ncbi:MAG: response regulator [Candidatus Aminicenantales bacterium]
MAKARILVVEDEFLVAHDISNMLIELGYDVMAIVPSAEEALAAIRAHAPDLILLDIRLKGPIDGIQVANIIKEEWSIPFIYLTAHADDLTLSRAKTSDPLGYLLKPFEFRELKTVIELAFYKHEKERQTAFWAIHDRVSGLPNKFLFLDHLSKAIFLGDRHHKRVGILAFVVLPSLTSIDGVPLGSSEIVPAVTERLMRILRKSDTLARLDSGEFIILLPDLETEEQCQIASRRILGIFDEPLNHEGRAVEVIVFSGLAITDEAGQDSEALLQKAMENLADTLKKAQA